MKLFGLMILVFLWGCSNDTAMRSPLFTNITAQSGLAFSNDLTVSEQFNPYTFRNFYNGAGVAVGDINNDGLLDIYFAGNQVDNALYLNKGNLSFEDITEKAGVACAGVWSTGVTFVDINADGLLDIYVCKSGNPDVPKRNNELFINNGDLTFTEEAKAYGLDITGLSVQAAFFDYDKDGDLDCYLLTNSIKSVGNYDIIKDQRQIPDPQGGGNKFLINEDGRFRDYSEAARIYRSNIGFGLGITLGDFNGDSWVDIFVSNDFFERDYLYINDQHGAFNESLTDYFQSISMGSMGADFADLDNDALPELFVTEMLPDSLHRKKTKTIYDSWNRYQLNVKNGYHHQFSRNVLQKKIGDKRYVELGRFAGVAASEWSWGALLFDMDNDGKRDVFIANGIYKDLLDRDYLTYTGAEENVKKLVSSGEKNAMIKLIELMPSSSFPNYAFKNKGKLIFENATNEWGLDEPMYSSGSAYGDFDNDGDLDLVVNNINMPAVLYRNNTDTARFKTFSLSLSARGKNTFAVGAQITAYRGNEVFFADNFVTRGFQSSVQPVVTIGLGENRGVIDSLIIQWPDGGYTTLYNIANERLVVTKEYVPVHTHRPEHERKSDGDGFGLKLIENQLFKHNGCGLVDFNRDRLLPMMYSNETPAMTKGDINDDGEEEIYVGGGKGQSGSFLRFAAGNIESVVPNGKREFNLAEETRGALLDVDGDEDLDLYFASGGRFFPGTSSVLMDKIFLNDGNGVFRESPHALPFTRFISTSVVKPVDFDNDGDSDLVVGERFDPFSYGIGGRGFLLENDGRGAFKDVTKEYAPELVSIGMITDIDVQDIDRDGWKDIILVGDWMPIVVLKNENKHFKSISEQLGLLETEGWWRDIESGDFNKDGKVDFVVANHGLNSFFKPGDRMYVSDFDQNGSIEQIFCTRIGEKYYPIVDKDELLAQLPSLKKTLLYYNDYGKKNVDALFSSAVMDDAKVFEVRILSSLLLLSGPRGYQLIDLPAEAQYSPLFALSAADFDNDGIEDLIAGGNQFQVKPQFGRYDASHGWFFKGVLTGGNFSFDAGINLNVEGQIRDIEYLDINRDRYLLFAKYDDNVEVYKIRR